MNDRLPVNRKPYPRLLSDELPERAPESCGFKLASFFCGAGGVDLGFRSAGFELTFANDYSAKAAETFARNLGHQPIVRDVREVAASEVPEVDVLTGGFPCVTFSTAGRRMGVTDDLNGKLYLELCRLIGEVKPRYFVAENVKGILSANGGMAIKLVCAAFLRLGYRTAWELVNMAEHGVPQTRTRVIFVGVRLDQWRGSFVFPRRSHRLGKDKRAMAWLPRAVSLTQAIGDIPPPGEHLFGMMHSDAKRKRFGHGVSEYNVSRPRNADEPSHSQVAMEPGTLIIGARNDQFANPLVEAAEPSPTITGGTLNVHTVNGEPNPYGPRSFATAQRFGQENLPSPTILSGGEVPGNDSPLVVSAPETPGLQNIRRMTVRECARVQSFPDWFVFEGSQADQYRQVGNAVPPLYAKVLAEAIKEYDRRPR